MKLERKKENKVIYGGIWGNYIYEGGYESNVGTQQEHTKNMEFLNRSSRHYASACLEESTEPWHCFQAVTTMLISGVPRGAWSQEQGGVWQSRVWSILRSHPLMLCLALGNGIISETRHLGIVWYLWQFRDQRPWDRPMITAVWPKNILSDALQIPMPLPLANSQWKGEKDEGMEQCT